jgi:hypothetical protein
MKFIVGMEGDVKGTVMEKRIDEWLANEGKN